MIKVISFPILDFDTLLRPKMNIPKDSIQYILDEVANKRMLARMTIPIIIALFLISLFSCIFVSVYWLRVEKGKRAMKVMRRRMNPKNLSDVRER